MGRPTKLTPTITALIATLIEDGNYAETAAEAAGIHRATFHTWMKKGDQQTSGQYKTFHDTIKKAQAKAETHHLNTITTAANNGTWQAAAWWLERTRPHQYAKRTIHQGDQTNPIHHTHTRQTLTNHLLETLQQPPHP